MVGFRIDIKECNQIKKEFTEVIKELKKYEKRLYIVKNTISSTAADKDIIIRLNKECEMVSQEREGVERLLSTFCECVRCYQNTEKKVEGQKIDWHMILDVAGMLPAVGVAFDGMNAAWYATEGEWGNALLSGMALIPGIGDIAGAGKTTAKAGGKIIGHIDEAADIAKAAEKVKDTAKTAKAAEEAEKIGKYADEAIESGSKAISDLSNKAVKHPMNDHMPARYAKQLQYMSKEAAEQYLSYKTFFNSNWTDDQVRAALNFGYKEALNSGVTTGKYSFKYLGENVTVCLEEGIFKTGYGDYVYTYDELLKLLGGE